MPTDAQLLTRAMLFAARKHSDQRRKGERAEPYVNHLAEVAEAIARHTGGDDVEVLCAALLHDTLEDTGTTYEELVRDFGESVASVVKECTDDKDLPKAERKRLQVENAPHKSARAKLVKLGDKISNLRSIIESPPRDWDSKRKQEYFGWAKRVIDGCRGVNPGLEAELDALYERGLALYGRPS